MNLSDIVAHNIRDRRNRAGLTTSGLSRELGMSSNLVWSWENGRCMPGAYSLCELADYFGCTVDELLGR